MTDSSIADLDSAIAVLQNGATFAPPLTALNLIESFQQQLQNLGKNEIANSLSALKQLLTGGSATGADIGQILVQLSSQTASVAESANLDSNKLQQLAQLLSEVGNSLLGAKGANEDPPGSFGSEV